jgi:hypothetical protein
VAIPTRYELSSFAIEKVILVDDVFEDLVESVANVEVTIGIRRAIVEGENVSGVVSREGFVYFIVVPEFLEFWFLFDRIGPHIKGGLREVDSLRIGAFFLVLRGLGVLASCWVG